MRLLLLDYEKYTDLKVSGQRLEWTKVRTGENTHGAIEFNKIKNQFKHPFEGSEQ